MQRRLVKVRFELGGDPVAGETVWAEPLGGGRFRLANVPFYAVGFAEADLVRCVRRGGWEEVAGVEEASGNGTLRLMFRDSESAEARQVLDELESVGCTYERASSMLVAVTVPPSLELPFSQVADFLNAVSDDVLPGWEIGKRMSRGGPTDPAEQPADRG